MTAGSVGSSQPLTYYIHCPNLPAGSIGDSVPRVLERIPPPDEPINHSKRYTLIEKVQILTLLSIGTPPRQINQWLGVPPIQCKRLLKKARDRGFRPEEDKTILPLYLEDGIKTGRPKKEISMETEAAILASANEKSSRVLAREHGISAAAVLKIFRENDVRLDHWNSKSGSRWKK